MNNVSAAGFTATLTCSGFGKNTFDAGSKGVIQGNFTYTETKSDTALQNGEPISRSIQWSESFAISTLPADTETVIVELVPSQEFLWPSMAMAITNSCMLTSMRQAR
jgi:hypothetical protein